MWVDLTTVGSIREELRKIVGKRIEFRANRGRRKCYISEGVLEDAYESIFAIAVRREDFIQRHSYSYCDVLTKNVELKVI